MATCIVTATPVTTDNPECVVRHARSVCSDALADLAGRELSQDSTDLRDRPDYWVGQLQYLLCYLLVAIEEADS